MEKGLRELKALSELCKRQKAEALGECATSSVSSDDDSDTGRHKDEQQVSTDERDAGVELLETETAVGETVVDDVTRNLSYENQAEVESKQNGVDTRLEATMGDANQAEVSKKARRRKHRRER
jgi:hypothetical protein